MSGLEASPARLDLFGRIAWRSLCSCSVVFVLLEKTALVEASCETETERFNELGWATTCRRDNLAQWTAGFDSRRGWAVFFRLIRLSVLLSFWS